MTLPAITPDHAAISLAVVLLSLLLHQYIGKGASRRREWTRAHPLQAAIIILALWGAALAAQKEPHEPPKPPVTIYTLIVREGDGYKVHHRQIRWYKIKGATP